MKWPTVVTVDKSGQERTRGPLSRAAAWKVGCCLEETKEDAKIFLEKVGEKEGAVRSSSGKTDQDFGSRT